jgi:hypothetical protein
MSVDYGGAKLLNPLEMLFGAISLVLLEAVVGLDPTGVFHEAVADDLGNNGGGGN